MNNYYSSWSLVIEIEELSDGDFLVIKSDIHGTDKYYAKDEEAIKDVLIDIIRDKKRVLEVLQDLNIEHTYTEISNKILSKKYSL